MDRIATAKQKLPVVAAPDADFSGHPHGEWASLEAIPEEVALAFDLANSRDERVFFPHSARTDGRDLLASAADLAAWLRYRGLATEEITDEDLELTRRVREVVRLLAKANADPAARDAARRALSDVADLLPLRVAMGDDGDLELEGVGPGIHAVLASVLARAVGQSGREAWSRLKMCAAEDCRWVFYDRSRPHTGRWCSMAVCGNRQKTREYRRRRQPVSMAEPADL